MEELIKLSDKTIYDIDTTILCTSEYNILNDAIEFINMNCEVISNTTNKNISEVSNDILNKFECIYLKEKPILTNIDHIKMNILSSLESNKKIFIFLNLLTYVEEDFKLKVINYLKDNNKRIINYTTEIEEVLILPYCMVIHENKIVMEGKTEQILNEEKLLKKLGFKLPFIIELSQGLKYYNVIDKIYYDNESLVNDLWK